VTTAEAPSTEHQPVELRGAVAALYRCTDPEVLIEGRAGTGKTIGILTRLLHLALLHPGCRILICRQTRESCTQSVLVSWEEKVLGPTHPMVVNGAERGNRNEYRFPNGSVVVVGGLDKPDKLFSTEWDVIYVNEATEISIDAWELFARAMRNQKIVDPLTGKTVHQRIADCNPGAPSHWLNKRATRAGDDLRDADTRDRYRRLQRFNHGPQPGPMRRLISVHQDNPAYFDVERWEWTTAGKFFITNLSSMSGHRQLRMLRGRWVSAEGTVFADFQEDRHVVEPFEIPDSWGLFVGVDPGYDHPCAILWIAVGPTGRYYVVDEIYQGGRSIAEHAEDVKLHNRTRPGRTVHNYFGDPQHAFSVTAQAIEPISVQFKKAMGCSMTPWPRSQDKEAMVEAVRNRLKLLGGDGKPMLQVFSTCENTIAEFQTWRYKRTAKGELPPGDDQYEDANNHALDVICGMVAMNLRPKPGGVRVIDPGKKK
jgi:hypothetical protein